MKPKRLHLTTTAETPYDHGGVFEASAFAKGDKWASEWITQSGRAIPSQRYVAQEGDTLESVAELFYGDASEADRLRAANRGIESQLQLGQELDIPAE